MFDRRRDWMLSFRTRRGLAKFGQRNAGGNRLAVALSLLLLMTVTATTQEDDYKSRSAADRHQPGGVVTRVVVMTGYEKALAMTDADRARRRQAGMSREEGPRSSRSNKIQFTYRETVNGRRNPELL